MSRNPLSAVLLSLALIGVALRFYGLGTPDLVGGDEGYYGTYARNILEGGLDQLLNLGREPLSAPDNKPFLFPLLLAGPVAALGPSEWALRSVPAAAGLLIAVAVAAIVHRRYGIVAGACAAVAALLLPPLVYSSRVVMGEGILAAFGLGGIWAALVALEERRASMALLAGALWGCGFLVKLWLVGLFILPVAVALVADARLRRELASWGLLILAGGSFVLVGGIHLVLVGLLSPETMGHWFNQYFIFSLLGRAGGGEFASYWHAPWSYYSRVTLQTCFPLLPLALLALSAARGRDEKDARRLPQVPLWGALAAELFLISFMAVKLRQYSFPLMPALAALAGIGADRLLRSEPVRRWAASIGAFALVIPVVVWQSGAPPLFPSKAVAAGAVAFLAGMGGLFLVTGRAARLAGLAVLAGTAAASLAGSLLTVKRESLDHRTGYREAARVIMPVLEKVPPREACFLSPEVPSLQFYLFRTGRYWSSPYERQDVGTLLEWISRPQFRAFITTARAELYGGLTPPEAVEWLARNTREVTADVERAVGKPIPIRVFVKEGAR